MHSKTLPLELVIVAAMQSAKDMVGWAVLLCALSVIFISLGEYIVLPQRFTVLKSLFVANVATVDKPKIRHVFCILQIRISSAFCFCISFIYIYPIELLHEVFCQCLYIFTRNVVATNCEKDNAYTRIIDVGNDAVIW